MKRKISKKLYFFLIGILLFCFFSCSFDEASRFAKEGYTTFEAEGIDFSELKAPGASGYLIGKEMICGKKEFNEDVYSSLNNGYAVCQLTSSKISLKFTIFSDKFCEKCKMDIKMAIENGFKYKDGIMPLDSSILDICVNGNSLCYDVVYIQGNASKLGYYYKFKDYPINSTFQLNQGENLIELKVVNNKQASYYSMVGNDGGAPGIDCIRIKSDSVLSWNSQEKENLENKK